MGEMGNLLASWVATGTTRRIPVLAVQTGTTLLRTPTTTLVLGSFVITSFWLH
jgi:hypothetical protein